MSEAIEKLKEAVIGGEYKTGRIPERRIVLDETKYYEALVLLEKEEYDAETLRVYRKQNMEQHTQIQELQAKNKRLKKLLRKENDE